MSETPPNQWTLAGAREMLVEVRGRTAKAVEEVEGLLVARDAHPEGSPAHARAEARIGEAIGRWARAMEALGLQVKGLWLVDFDNGSGCYCWRWPETGLAWFHGHDEGFEGRVRIQ
jgi:hypothetical protein